VNLESNGLLLAPFYGTMFMYRLLVSAPQLERGLNHVPMCEGKCRLTQYPAFFFRCIKLISL
jgi:hypothetical protein